MTNFNPEQSDAELAPEPTIILTEQHLKAMLGQAYNLGSNSSNQSKMFFEKESYKSLVDPIFKPQEPISLLSILKSNLPQKSFVPTLDVIGILPDSRIIHRNRITGKIIIE